MVLFTIVIVTNLLQIALETKYWYPLMIWSHIVSLLCYFVTVFCLDFSYSHIILSHFGGQNYQVFSVRISVLYVQKKLKIP